MRYQLLHHTQMLHFPLMHETLRGLKTNIEILQRFNDKQREDLRQMFNQPFPGLNPSLLVL